jgi:hypothetical protein
MILRGLEKENEKGNGNQKRNNNKSTKVLPQTRKANKKIKASAQYLLLGIFSHGRPGPDRIGNRGLAESVARVNGRDGHVFIGGVFRN